MEPSSAGQEVNVGGTQKKRSSKRPSDEDYALLQDYFEDVPRKKVYMKEHLLGVGGFGRVYQVTELETAKRTSFADKIISKAIFSKRTNAKEKVQKEIDIHKLMIHPNVVKFFCSFENESFVHIILENCSQKSLLHVLKYRSTITEPETRYYMKQILLGARYIHKRGFLHRDLKLGNMLLSLDMVVKIGDFGLACVLGDSKPGSMCGTPNYIAPEVLAKKGHGVAADIWAMGCMAYAMLVGTPPFETQALQTTYDKIAKCEYTVPEDISVEAKSLIRTMLSLDPEERGHLGVAGEPANDNLLTHIFFESEFTPTQLPTHACVTAPRFPRQPTATPESPWNRRDVSGHSSSSASSRSLAFSPVHVPPSQLLSSALHQTLGCFFGRGEQSGTFLQRGIDNLKRCKNLRHAEPISTNTIPVFINKWIDYSNKYGFGFQLSDGTVGIFFNDKSRIASAGKLIEFTDTKNDAFYMERNEGPIKYPELKKRVALLDYFEDYMEQNLADGGAELHQLKTVSTRSNTRVPQMKRWVRRASTNSVAMEMNNHLIQVSFLEERVQIILWEHSEEMFLTMKTSRQKFYTYSLSTLLAKGCPPQIQCRIAGIIEELNALEEIKQVEDPVD